MSVNGVVHVSYQLHFWHTWIIYSSNFNLYKENCHIQPFSVCVDTVMHVEIFFHLSLPKHIFFHSFNKVLNIIRCSINDIQFCNSLLRIHVCKLSNSIKNLKKIRFQNILKIVIENIYLFAIISLYKQVHRSNFYFKMNTK